MEKVKNDRLFSLLLTLSSNLLIVGFLTCKLFKPLSGFLTNMLLVFIIIGLFHNVHNVKHIDKHKIYQLEKFLKTIFEQIQLIL